MTLFSNLRLIWEFIEIYKFKLKQIKYLRLIKNLLLKKKWNIWD